MNFLELIKTGVNWVLNLGAATMLPIIMIIFGLILGQGFKKSFKSGVTIGIGFVGLNLVIQLLTNSVGAAAQALVKNLGVHLSIIDVGWPVGAAITFATPIAALLIPAIFIFNMILLYFNMTKTMDVDIWNYWHLIFPGAMVYYAFDKNIVLAIVVALINTFVIFKLADWTAPVIEHYFGLPGISLPHGETVNFAPIMYTLNKIEDKIPLLNKVVINEKIIEQKMGVFGEPLTIGLILGLILGALGRYNVANTLTLGIQMAAVMVLMPKMVGLLMEGLMPISEGAREFISKKFPGKEVYIGLDAAVVVGNPSNMAVALIMIPITIVLSIILPYNRLLPFADLAALPFTVIWAVAATKGNIFRGLINSIITMCGVFFIATNLGALTTTLGHAVGFAFPKGATMISGIDMSCHVTLWILLKIFDIKNLPVFLVGLIALIAYAGMWFWVRNDIKKQYNLDDNFNKIEGKLEK
ncbi:MAG: PTS galactitol transporter subunit IIC [Clostridium sp.]|jgi:PTS system galactitol-specific IIC component|uniref:PTS galactitol transporter subunit IIC n=1 Tax=Clostridium sp. TaxID=1506 RepID=UPI0025BB92B1|nr:PTS transporter subunit IIC [Clostridium sp.]MCH3965844.1 PTS galactitol transporter subunit IIC [Clostridium sp.]MCI1716067.1 PTS galactitol transporter subunit IIC [Clostridium sp.]MCI1800261.1 PTS galactitol transporter subunit IIC [Clostridium sp.]MCI1814244.1 PTS galactitol transporter subunit IIC [Clostridium sp.]MCI1871143.1 PTS galactitol transporter subunit IIC [Clostridium sp.]